MCADLELISNLLAQMHKLKLKKIVTRMKNDLLAQAFLSWHEHAADHKGRTQVRPGPMLSCFCAQAP